MSSAPRPEEELRGLLAANGEEVRKIEARKAAHAAVRQPIEDALPGAEHALAYGQAWKPPAWWGRDNRHPDPKAVRGVVERLRAALAALGAGGDHPLLHRLAGDEFQPVSTSDARKFEERLEELQAEREALQDELERRLRGEGEPGPYLMLTGTMTRWEGDKATGKRVTYRAGAIVSLTDWQADSRFEPVEQEMATASTSNA